MIDKEYIKKLCQGLCFNMSEHEMSMIIEHIKLLEKMMEKSSIDLNNIKATPVNFTRAQNCAHFRKDVIQPKQDENYLGNAKVANKYVVGK